MWIHDPINQWSYFGPKHLKQTILIYSQFIENGQAKLGQYYFPISLSASLCPPLSWIPQNLQIHTLWPLAFSLLIFEAGSDSSKYGANVVRECPWFLAAPFKLRFVEFCIMFADTPICGNNVFCGSVDHGTLCFPAFY